MAIAFVNGAVGTASAATTVSVTYSPTAGNTVCVFFGFVGSVTNLTVTDSALNPLAAGPTALNGIFGACFYYTAASGITSFIANWTGSTGVNAAVVEYSGAVGGVNPSLAGNTATGTSATASITVTTQDNNDWIVGGIVSSGNVTTVTVGNLRENAPSAAAKLKAADNTVATAGAVSLTATLTSAAWLIVVLELRSVVIAGGGSTSNWLTKAVATGVNKHT